MQQMQVEVLSDDVNYVVLRTKGRSYPGVVIQGDNLRILYWLSRRIREAVTVTGNSDLRDDADELEESLRDRVLHYQRVLDAAGIPLPYPDRVVD